MSLAPIDFAGVELEARWRRGSEYRAAFSGLRRGKMLGLLQRSNGIRIALCQSDFVCALGSSRSFSGKLSGRTPECNDNYVLG